MGLYFTSEDTTVKKSIFVVMVGVLLSFIWGNSVLADELNYSAFIIGQYAGLYTFVTIDSDSMNPTLESGDDVAIQLMAEDSDAPERGDVIMYKTPLDVARGEDTYYIHRIIGLSGETVEIKDGAVHINGEKLEEDYINGTWVVANDGYTFEVPEDHYLVLGDNRNNSSDSRYWADIALRERVVDNVDDAISYSYVDGDQIYGKVISKIVFEPVK